MTVALLILLRWKARHLRGLAMRDRLTRYIEWQSSGRRTGRAAYVIGKQNLPRAIAGAEWQVDPSFNAAEEILRDPTLKDSFQAAIASGVKLVT
jgi:hypothetical protein